MATARLAPRSPDRARGVDWPSVYTALVHADEGIDMIQSIEPPAVILARVIAEAEAALARRFD